MSTRTPRVIRLPTFSTTQFDAFAHQMWGDSFYNCFKLGDIATRNGFKKLGADLHY